MEILLFIGGLCALGVLAMRFGYDSRDDFRSPEETLANFGFAWHGKPGRPQRTPRRKPVNVVRHRLAVGLNALADWLYPLPENTARLNSHAR
jgi:hypothetical protein